MSCVWQYNVLCALGVLLLLPVCLKSCRYVVKLILLAVICSTLLLSVLYVNVVVLDARDNTLHHLVLTNYTSDL